MGRFFLFFLIKNKLFKKILIHALEYLYNWNCFRYITPNSKRALLKKAKSRKYQDRVEAKAAYEAGRPTGPTFKVDETDEVFQTIEEPESDSVHQKPRPGKKRKQKKKTKKGSEKMAVTAGEEPDE